MKAALFALGLAGLCVLAGCSRSAPRAARSEAEAPETSDDARTSSGTKGAERAEEAPGEPDASKDDLREAEKKATEEPSLSQAPAAEPASPWREADAPVEDLQEKEERFTQAIDPSALSCSGALPLKDAICTLAERICALAAGHTEDAAERDCKRAKSSCDKAKQSYAGRCGG